MKPMILKVPSPCCKSPILVWIKGKSYFMCPCGEMKINGNGQPVGMNPMKIGRGRPGRPKKGQERPPRGDGDNIFRDAFEEEG